MKEYEFINIIKDLTKSQYIGDDCAYLSELGIVITQDNFVENIHFKKDWYSPYQIGYKAVTVNISDILASGGKPEYISVGISLPNNVDDKYFKELYHGIIEGAQGSKIIGGDITGAEKIILSITAIGSTKGRKISSRKNAKAGQLVVISGKHGESSKGLRDLENGIKNTKEVNIHLEPKLDIEFSEIISKQIKTDYAMMDTSDGLANALFQIAKSSKVKIIVEEIDGIFGSEDYKLVATLDKDFIKKLKNPIIIGKVAEFDGNYLQINNKNFNNYSDLNLYNHFE